MLNLLFLACLAAFAADAPPPTTAVPGVVAERTADQWIAAVDARATALPGLRYSAQRTTVRNGTTVEERWRFVQSNGCFRIDYFGDTARQITFDGRYLVQYIPAKRAAMRTDISAMSAVDGAEQIGQVLRNVAIPGFRVGASPTVTWTVKHGVEEGISVIVLDGVGPDGSTLTHVIDPSKDAVLRSTIHAAGQDALVTQSRDLREIAPGIWLPHEIDLRAPEAGGEARVTMRLTKVTVVADHPAALFDAGLDPSIPVTEYP